APSRPSGRKSPPLFGAAISRAPSLRISRGFGLGGDLNAAERAGSINQRFGADVDKGSRGMLVTARSTRPSPLKSPAAAAIGTPLLRTPPFTVNGEWGAARKVPSP